VSYPPRPIDYYESETEDGHPVLVIVDEAGGEYPWLDEDGNPMSLEEALEAEGLSGDEPMPEYGDEYVAGNGEDLHAATEQINAQNWATSLEKSLGQLERELGRPLNPVEAKLVLDEAEAHERPNAVECYRTAMAGYDESKPGHRTAMAGAIAQFAHQEAGGEQPPTADKLDLSDEQFDPTNRQHRTDDALAAVADVFDGSVAESAGTE